MPPRAPVISTVLTMTGPTHPGQLSLPGLASVVGAFFVMTDESQKAPLAVTNGFYDSQKAPDRSSTDRLTSFAYRGFVRVAHETAGTRCARVACLLRPGYSNGRPLSVPPALIGQPAWVGLKGAACYTKAGDVRTAANAVSEARNESPECSRPGLSGCRIIYS